MLAVLPDIGEHKILSKRSIITIALQFCPAVGLSITLVFIDVENYQFRKDIKGSAFNSKFARRH